MAERIPTLPPLNLPHCDLQIRNDGRIVRIFDPLRSRFVALTPEEYVRRLFTNYMTETLHYPPSVTSNEVQIRLNGTAKRCDTVVFAPDGHPLMIVEYKAPEVPITQSVFDQIVRYNMVLRADYLTVSNGMVHYCCQIDYHKGSYTFLQTIPDYRDLKNVDKD